MQKQVITLSHDFLKQLTIVTFGNYIRIIILMIRWIEFFTTFYTSSLETTVLMSKLVIFFDLFFSFTLRLVKLKGKQIS